METFSHKGKAHIRFDSSQEIRVFLRVLELLTDRDKLIESFKVLPTEELDALSEVINELRLSLFFDFLPECQTADHYLLLGDLEASVLEAYIVSGRLPPA